MGRVMSKSEFDEYRDTYVEAVEKSVDFSGLDHEFFQISKSLKLRDLVQKYFGRRQKVSLLDVGCGVGAMHPYINPDFDRIFGVDVSGESIKQAKINNPSLEYTHYDGHRLPFKDNSFDMSLAVCVLHHVPPEQWHDFLAEKARVVRPGGLVCLIEHNPVNPATRLSVARCPFDKDAVLLGARQMCKHLKTAGLHDVFSEHFVFFPTNRPFFRQVERRLGWLPLGAQYLALGHKK